jgi:hypothetical protein
VTKGAARRHLGWVRRAAGHPQVVAALAEGTLLSESVAQLICQWTDKLSEDCRQAADAILVTAVRAGVRKEDLAGLAAEIYARSLPDPDDDGHLGLAFEDRRVRVETTFGGAGVVVGDLTAECAAALTAVLDSLSAPVGADDTRTKDQRYHDALEQAMRRLVASGLLPERAGHPVKIWAHVSLAELRALDDGSVLQADWIGEMAVRWAARRAAASEGSGSDGGAWLTGKAVGAVACDAIITPVVTGDVDPGVLDDLVRLCVQLDRLDHGALVADPAGPPPAGPQSPRPEPPADVPPGLLSQEALRKAIIGKTIDFLMHSDYASELLLRQRHLGLAPERATRHRPDRLSQHKMWVAPGSGVLQLVMYPCPSERTCVRVVPTID